MTEEKLTEFFLKFVPRNAVEFVVPLVIDEPLKLRITRGRKSKFGDYRPPYNQHGHRLSVNGDLNPYAFLLTLIHELAHYRVEVEHGKHVKPHGREWKNTFKEMMIPFMTPAIFPEDILCVLKDYMSDPKASTCSDPRLFQTLNLYNIKSSTYLADIEPGAVFTMNGRVFKKLEKKRTRYKCMEIPGKRLVLINGIAEVETVK